MDPVGFLTLKKKIISIYNENRELIGFTVLTYKRGRSVKTGPTMFLDDFRKQGYGQLFRKALEDRLKREGERKIYCTATVTNREVLNYLLSSDYKIECQLGYHYGMFDELVFGKFLKSYKKEIVVPKIPIIKRQSTTIKISDDVNKHKENLAKFMVKEFSRDITKINNTVATNFIRDSFRKKDLSYEDKPKKLIIGLNGTRAALLCICLPKRGGALKSVILSSTSNILEIQRIILETEKYALQENRHKLYFTIPEHRQDIIHSLVKLEYKIEGMLQQPYKSGVNIFIASKIFDSTIAN